MDPFNYLVEQQFGKEAFNFLFPEEDLQTDFQAVKDEKIVKAIGKTNRFKRRTKKTDSFKSHYLSKRGIRKRRGKRNYILQEFHRQQGLKELRFFGDRS